MTLALLVNSTFDGPSFERPRLGKDVEFGCVGRMDRDQTSILITLIAWLVFGRALDLPAVIGLALIIAGVIVLNVFSKSGAH